MKHTIKNYNMLNQNKSNKIKKQIRKKFCKSKLRTKLETVLNKRGVEFRPDSALCANFINGKTNLSLDYIVQRMCEMKYLYEYCNMKSIREQVYMNYVNSESVKDYKGTISTQAEKIALETHSNGTYPDIFPWENNKINKIDKVNNVDDFDFDYDYDYNYECRCKIIQNIYIGFLMTIFVGFSIILQYFLGVGV